jgi:hypothetical protein
MESDGQPFAQISMPQVWIGGQSELSPWSTCTQIKSLGGGDGELVNPRGLTAFQPFYDGGLLRAAFSPNLSDGRVLTINHETLHPSLFMMRGGIDTYFLLEGQPGTYLTMTGPKTTFTGGRSKAQPGVLNVPRLFVGEGASARNVDYGPAAPTAGYHAQGELVFNSAPTAGGMVGWSCVASGTPGTWKAFGAIDE